jgi:AraC-like DNA-binding protein
MDAISEALKVVRVTGAAFFNAEFTAPWGFDSPPTETVAAALSAAGTERLAIYHLVTVGVAHVRVEGSPALPLAAGDLVVFPHGHRHAMSNGRPRTMHDMARDLPRLLSDAQRVMRLGGDGEPTRFVCGYFGFDRHASRLFLAGLPPVVRVGIRDSARASWLENSIGFAMAEAARRRPGSAALLAKLSEALFVEALCRYMDQMPPESTGWLAAVRDAVVGRALAALHRDPSRPWTVAALGREAGASRTVLAERFMHFLGEPPMSYLANWRLQLGARMLETTRHTVNQVAAEVGYESEAAFNRAFKREFGLPPARYRRARTVQHRLPTGVAAAMPEQLSR